MSTKQKEKGETSPTHIPTSATALLDRFLEYILIEKGLSENTLVAYSTDLRDFLSFLADNRMDLSDVSETTLFLYIVYARKRGIGGRSLARHMAALRGYFFYAREQKLIEEDPARFLENPKLHRSLPDVLSKEEMDALLDQPDTNTKLGFRDRTMLELLYASGLRVSELCELEPLHFDPQTNLLRVFGKGAKERIVPIHEQAAAYLSDYLRHWRALFCPQDTAIFLNRSGKRLSRVGVWKLVQRYTLQAGINTTVSPHTFRHSFATHLLEGGADLRSVQMLLGHADVTATEIYTHVQQERVTETHRRYHPRSYGNRKEHE